MADNQYDLPPKVIRLFHEKQKIRKAIQDEILRRETNPHFKYTEVHDAAILRYHALFEYRSEHVRPTPRNLAMIFFTTILPFGVIYYSKVTHHEKKEKLIRSGQIRYEDRCYKGVY